MITAIISKFELGAVGEIVMTQTTFCEFICREDLGTSRFRVNYLNKLEFDIKRGPFTLLQLLTEHPLLIEYREPRCTVYLSGQVRDKERFISALETAALEHFDGWRTVYRYINPSFRDRLPEFFDHSFGILMEAPESFARRVIEVADELGVALHTREGGGAVSSPKLLLLLDRWYVIADEFSAEEIVHSAGNT